MKQVGTWWVPDSDTHLAAYLASSGGQYQKPQRRVSLEHCARRRVALDVGAHIGLWSRQLAAEFEAVHAFEPVAEFRECFARNVGAANVQLHPFALGNAACRAKIEFASANTGMTRIVDVGDEGVEVRTLDSLSLGAVDYIKLDVEGFELFVLEGAHETLLRCRPLLTLEQKGHGAQHFGVEQYEALDYLKALGAVVLGRVVDDWIVGWPGQT
jgi:FkbM family methyltransferase